MYILYAELRQLAVGCSFMLIVQIWKKYWSSYQTLLNVDKMWNYNFILKTASSLENKRYCSFSFLNFVKHILLTIHQQWENCWRKKKSKIKASKAVYPTKHYRIPQRQELPIASLFLVFYCGLIWSVMMEHLKCVPSGMTGSNGPSSHYCLSSWTVDGPPMCHYAN